MRRLLRSRGGQIVIPAMLMFPTLFLFVYLIYETAKLSREKIRHQFAVDAAAFVEMANYSDFLNRTAYVNGAFPMRIFTEGYGDFPTDCEGKTDHCKSVMYADLLYKNGAFPRSKSGATAFSSEPAWDIQYCSGTTGHGDLPCEPGSSAKNDEPPTLPDPFLLFVQQDANEFWHQWDLATEIYKLWVQIYSLLGSVEDAQFSVLKRLTTQTSHSFLQKSYWLNTGDPPGDAAQLAAAFDASLGDFEGAVQPVCLNRMDYWGNTHIGGTGIQPYSPQHADPIIALQTTAPCSTGLFQTMFVKPSMISRLRGGTGGGGGYPGIPLSTGWAYPRKNYWNVGFDGQIPNSAGGNPTLHVTISLLGDPSTKPSVWQENGVGPTPKFQVREFP